MRGQACRHRSVAAHALDDGVVSRSERVERSPTNRARVPGEEPADQPGEPACALVGDRVAAARAVERAAPLPRPRPALAKGHPRRFASLELRFVGHVQDEENRGAELRELEGEQERAIQFLGVRQLQDHCAVCLDQKDDGDCGLRGRTCAIERHLPGVVAAVTAIESGCMDDYVAAIESEVCAHCSDQDGAGRCGLRARGQCALYAYLSFIVDAVQAFREEEARSRRRAPPA